MYKKFSELRKKNFNSALQELIAQRLPVPYMAEIALLITNEIKHKKAYLHPDIRFPYTDSRARVATHARVTRAILRIQSSLISIYNRIASASAGLAVRIINTCATGRHRYGFRLI